jgi:hypothetical protein
VWDILEDGFPVCGVCGTIDRSYREFDDRAPYEKKDPWAKPWEQRNGRRVDGPLTRGRYKEKFHYNERVSQWRMHDPEIPPGDWKRIEEEGVSGKYGPPEELTRASVILVTRTLKLQKYRERWKTVLSCLNPTFRCDEPAPEFLAWAEKLFPLLVNTFYQHRKDMPKSVIRKKNGDVESRNRHNFPSYNYTQRKMLEIYGTWDFHHEFPVPRSHNKLHALDDVFEKMCLTLGLPFQRSAVIKRPKLRKIKFN